MLKNPRFASTVLVVSIFWLAAAASFAGFVGKWGLRESGTTGGILEMFSQKAGKPFIYRQLVPSIATIIDKTTPISIRKFVDRQIHPEDTFVRTTGVRHDQYHYRYQVVYILTFLAFFISLFVLRQILLDLGTFETIALFAPVTFVLFVPYLQTVGGYYYDATELLFMGLAILAAMRRKLLLIVLIGFLATLNKETFIFFLPTLYPIIRQHASVRDSAVALTSCILVSAIANLAVKTHFSTNNGGVAIFHLVDNLTNYFDPSVYLGLENTYGLPGPSRMFILTLLVICIIFTNGWEFIPSYFRAHAIIAALVTLPLLLLFCAAGELRNLSFLYVVFVIFIAKTMELLFNQPRKND